MPRSGERRGPIVLALLVVVAGSGSCGSTAGSARPDMQVHGALARQTRATLLDNDGSLSGRTVELDPIHFRQITSSEVGGRVYVVSMVDIEGRVIWSERSAALSYIGREHFRMVPCDTEVWCPDGDQFSRLRGVLGLLVRREDAMNGRDGQALEALGKLVSSRYEDRGENRNTLLARVAADFKKEPEARIRVVAWQIRIERDSARVGEDREAMTQGRAPERRRALYTLAKEGQLWSFVSGL